MATEFEDVQTGQELPPDQTLSSIETVPLGSVDDIEKVRSRVLKRISEASNWINEQFDTNWRLYFDQYRIKKDPKRSRHPNDEWHSDAEIPMIFGVNNTKKPGVKLDSMPQNLWYGLEPIKDNETDAAGKVVVDYDMTARAYEEIIRLYLHQMRFRSHVNDMLTDSGIFHIAPFFLHWKYEEGKRKYFDLKEGEVYEVEDPEAVLYDGPECGSISPFDFLIDPKAKSLQGARYIAHLVELDVESVRNNPQIYTGPDVERFLSEASDKNIERVEVYNYFERTRWVSMVKSTNFIIRDHINPYKHGLYPFFSISEFPLQRSVYGIPTAELLSDIQTYERDMLNLAADQTLLSTIGVPVVEEGTDISERNMQVRPGKPMVVPRGTKTEWYQPPVAQGVDQMLARFEGVINRAVGNQEYMNPINQEGVSTNDTATGAQIINNNMQGKRADFVQYLRDEFFRPFLEMMIELIQQYQTPEGAVKMIGERKAKALMLEPAKIDWQAKFLVHITGEDGRLTKAQQIDKGLKFAEIAQKMPEIKPILKNDKLGRHIARWYDLPDDVIKTEEEMAQDIASANAAVPAGQAQPGGANELDKVTQQIMQATGLSEQDVTVRLAKGESPEQIMGGADVSPVNI